MPEAHPDLLAWSDDALADLLRRRPDLATPAPGSITALITRAGTAHSLALAVRRLDRAHLAAAEAVVALTVLERGSDAESVSHAIGLPALPLLQSLAAQALVVPESTGWQPVPGLREALPQPVAGLALDVTREPGASAATERDLRTLSDGARRMLDALLWRSPVGTLPRDTEGPAATAVRELRDAGALVTHGSGRVAVPGAIALDLRGGRTHRSIPATAPTPQAVAREEESIRAEAALAGQECVRHLEDLTDAWANRPAPALRSGGVGVRELKRTADELGLAEQDASLLMELAAEVGAVGTVTDEDGVLWAPVQDDGFARAPSGGPPARGGTQAPGTTDPVAIRWAEMAAAWWRSDRAFALVGSRAPDSALYSALEPGLERGWARSLRRSVFAALAAWPHAAAPDSEAIQAHLAWSAPVTPPPTWAVQAVLRESAWLGAIGAGALSEVGRALLDLEEDDADPDDPADPDDGRGTDREVENRDVENRAGEDRADETRPGGGVPSPTATRERVPAALIAACASVLPPTVDRMVVQADLTAVVPGRPSAALRALLRVSAQVESRGGALTVRFTPRSLETALHAGTSAGALLEDLREASMTPLPQALEYAIGDAQRRLGSLRVGAATCYLRADDPAELAALLAHRDLDLRPIAPTVAITHHRPTTLAHLIGRHGMTARVEGPDGALLELGPRRTSAPTRPATSSAHRSSRVTRTARQAAVRAMREGEERAGFSSASGGEGGTDPSVLRARLAAAVRTAAPVVLAIADGDGAVVRRRVLPLRVGVGSVLGRDLERGTDLTVALHRLLDVAT
ncbi:helicase-associated domain-containing protein [Serinibacter salmoneus]|uniref:XPB/Ssl2-like helicase family protein n=1 Tax=Serinibacter salmoneus TaxID=556530 RepID=A0A2A9D3T6_9MICO|nr:helicase-associated domain-containing protein [Serinibacter salmoneus]PFG20509.1 XPB/Ssl2-like helicase family protein [Serinibacter salmoneus]